MGPTQILAAHAAGSRPEDLPEAVVHESKRSFLNWLGVAIGACNHPTVEILLDLAADVGGNPQATILGRDRRTDILNAALVNGASSHVFDFDDTHLRTIIHPTGPIAPGLLALAEHRGGLSGRDFLHALVVGIEVECRVGNAVYPSHYDVGWHITGTAGVIGAAAGAARALGLNAEATTTAIGIATTQAAGLREMFGTMCKPFHVGRAAQNGLLAALLASRGFTSSTRALEAPRGFANVLATERDYTEITGELGSRYEILRNTYKPFACGIVIHPAIDACIQLRDRHHLTAADVESVELKVHPLVLELTGKTEPGRGLEAKFSVYHSAAVALIDGAAGEAQYSDERVLDPAVIALRQRVRATASPGISEAEVVVRLGTRDGQVHEIHVRNAVGSLERPMSDADLERKFRGLVDPVLSGTRSAELLDLCWNLDSLPDAAVVARASVPAHGNGLPAGASR